MRVPAVLLAFACGWAGTSAAAEDRPDVARLVVQLGSDKFTDRERATQALDALGVVALDPLKAATGHSDLEVRRRAQALVKRIEARLETEKLLAPTRLRLELEDVPLAQALRDLANKSGHTIVLQGPAQKFQARRVTLDTGTTTFWEALDALCVKAKLTEGGPILAEAELLASTRDAPDLFLRQEIARRAARAGTATYPPAPAAESGEAQTFSPAVGTGKGIPVVLKDGLVEGAMSYAGAVRIRAVFQPSVRTTGKPDELSLQIDVAAEPSLQSLKVRHLRLERAADELGQVFTEVVPPSQTGVDVNQILYSHRTAPTSRAVPRDLTVLHLQQPDKAGTSLKTVKGTVVAMVQTRPEALITVADLKNAAGTSVAGPTGGSIRINQAELVNGEWRLRVEVEAPPDPESAVVAVQAREVAKLALLQQRALLAAQPGIRIAFAAPTLDAATTGLTLQDGQGREYPPSQVSSHARADMRGGNPVVIQEQLVRFRVPGGGAPAKLIYSGTRTHLVEIPFELRDLKLQ